MGELKEPLQKTVKKLQDENINLKETPAYFSWIYDDDPTIKYEMLISEIDPEEEDLDLKFVTLQ